MREDKLPLSEEELRLLEQMERALVAEDPKLASTMRGTTLRAAARRRVLFAGLAFVVGIALLMTGAVSNLIPVGVVGFLVMLGSAYVGLMAWRGQNRAPEQPAKPSGGHPSFTVVDGGRKRRPGRPSRPTRNRNRTSGSMMERFEERWRRRRDQNGF